MLCYNILPCDFRGFAQAMPVATARFAHARREHNHGRCISRALKAAAQVCAERELHLTPIRLRVLELVWQRHAPVGAYDLLAAFSKAGKPAAPPTIYRALEFLQAAGLVHRIDSLNAFMGCEAPQVAHAGQFLVCRSCHLVTELYDAAITRLLTHTASESGFAAEAQSIEIKGLCRSCRMDFDKAVESA
jgi:Fur family transcriptional regulator, zinc uptake regulator